MNVRAKAPMATVSATEMLACLSDVENLRSKQCAGITALTSAVVGTGRGPIGADAKGFSVAEVDRGFKGLGRCWFKCWAVAFEGIDIVGPLEGESNVIEAI